MDFDLENLSSQLEEALYEENAEKEALREDFCEEELLEKMSRELEDALNEDPSESEEIPLGKCEDQQTLPEILPNSPDSGMDVSLSLSEDDLDGSFSGLPTTPGKFLTESEYLRIISNIKENRIERKFQESVQRRIDVSLDQIQPMNLQQPKLSIQKNNPERKSQHPSSNSKPAVKLELPESLPNSYTLPNEKQKVRVSHVRCLKKSLAENSNCEPKTSDSLSSKSLEEIKRRVASKLSGNTKPKVAKTKQSNNENKLRGVDRSNGAIKKPVAPQQRLKRVVSCIRKV